MKGHKSALMGNTRTQQNLVCCVGSVAQGVWCGQWKTLVVSPTVCVRLFFSGMALRQTAALYAFDSAGQSASASDCGLKNTRNWG